MQFFSALILLLAPAVSTAAGNVRGSATSNNHHDHREGDAQTTSSSASSNARELGSSSSSISSCNYQCPPFSFPKPNRNCYNNFDDCECSHGYYKKYGRCFKQGTSYITLKVTNLSFLQPFGEFFVATHKDFTPPLFTLGDQASPELARLAEDGNADFLVNRYNHLPGVGEVFAFDQGAPVFGGDTVFIDIPYDPAYPYVTVASMAINTNDCFVSINGRRLQSGDVFTGVGYDSGTEENNERCDSIPGPACANIDSRNIAHGKGEGFVHVHRGFFGIGPNHLAADRYDWRNPMVRWEVL